MANFNKPEIIRKLYDLEATSATLDWHTPEQFSSIAEDMRIIVENFIHNLPTTPTIKNESFNRSSIQDLVHSPRGLSQALSELATILQGSGIDTTNSRFMGYIPGGGLPAAAATNFITSLLNRYVGMYGAAPGASSIENQALEWLRLIFKLPEKSWGTFTSGGSIATLTALVAARDAKISGKIENAICYMSEEVHFVNRRALHVLGIPLQNIRVIKCDEFCRMDIKNLNANIENDRNNSLIPWLVIASGGTTGTGSIDPLEEIANICKKYNCWFHVDAAYGGMFALLPTLQQQLPLALADSFVIDPHKAMFLPYGCGAVFVADGELLRESLTDGGAILAGIESREYRSANDYSLELTRPSRGAQIWTVLRAHGQDCIAAGLEEKLLLASYFHHLLDESNLFEVFPAQDLTVVTFRLPGDNEHTEKLLATLTEQGRYLLSSTKLNEKFYIRCCILNFRTHLAEIDGLCAELIKHASK